VILEDGTDRLSLTVGKKLPKLAYNNPEERSSQLHRGGSLKSRNEMDNLVLVLKFTAGAKKIQTGPVTHRDSYLLGKGVSIFPVTKPPGRHTDLSPRSRAKFNPYRTNVENRVSS